MKTLNKFEHNIAKFINKNPTTTIALMYLFLISMLVLWAN